MNARRLTLAGIVCSVALAATYKIAPRMYNAHKLSQLAGRHVYDEKADSMVAEKALQVASQQHKRVLAIMGGNWCQWCLALDDMMNSDEEIRSFVAEHYVLLKVDIDTSEELDRVWGNPSQRGVPVLDASSIPTATSPTSRIPFRWRRSAAGSCVTTAHACSRSFGIGS